MAQEEAVSGVYGTVEGTDGKRIRTKEKIIGYLDCPHRRLETISAACVGNLPDFTQKYGNLELPVI